MKKIICLILAMAMLSALFASCGGAPKLPNPENSKTVFTLGGKKIVYDYARYVYLNTKADMEYGEGSGYWANNPEAFEELKTATFNIIARYRAIEMLAKKYNISLTETDKKNVAAMLKELKNDKESWAEIKKESFMSDYVFAYMQRFALLWEKIYYHVTSPESGIIKSDDQTVLVDIPVNFRNIRYVYIGYSETNKATKRAIAEEVLLKANSGEDFVQLIDTYGEDSTMAGIIDEGYYYTNGSIDEIVENAIKTLNIGEISPIIDAQGGFFIVQRIDIDLEYAMENIETFIDYYVARVFNEMVSDIESNMKIELSDFWKNLTIDDIK